MENIDETEIKKNIKKLLAKAKQIIEKEKSPEKVCFTIEFKTSFKKDLELHKINKYINNRKDNTE